MLPKAGWHGEGAYWVSSPGFSPKTIRKKLVTWVTVHFTKELKEQSQERKYSNIVKQFEIASDSLGRGWGPLTLPAFIVMVDAAELVVPLSLPLGILKHIKQFQVTFQQTEAGSPYTMELPVLNEYATSDTSKRPDKS